MILCGIVTILLTRLNVEKANNKLKIEKGLIQE